MSMLTILLHTSKTMRGSDELKSGGPQKPVFLSDAQEIAQYVKQLNAEALRKSMALSPSKAQQTHALFQKFEKNSPTLPALDIFLGDIYSGLQAQSFTDADREYANEHLYILSGLYGVLKALDEVQPYRFEMGYKFADLKPYEFWGDKIAKQLPKNQDIINLSVVEYTKAVFPYIKEAKIISPKFLTVSPKTAEPTFVTVHAKIARGAYARWLIQNRVEELSGLKKFSELGYRYDAELSTDEEPVFVAQVFQGIGLSVRLTEAK